MNRNLNDVYKDFRTHYDVVNSLLKIQNLAIYEARHVTKYNKNLDEYAEQFKKQDPYYYGCIHLIKKLVDNFGWVNSNDYKELTNKKKFGLHDVLNLINYSLNKILTVN